MKKIKAINGYTIYQATARDVSKYNVEYDDFVLYFSSDIRDYGLAFSDIEYIACSIEEAEAFATGTNYAIAKEIVEETTTAASFDEIVAVEAMLDSGMKVSDLISMDIDIDVYDDVCEELGIAFCGPMELTPLGKSHFAEVMNYGVSLIGDHAIVLCDGDGWRRKLRKACEFFNAAAGYCPADDYDKWFVTDPLD